MAYMMQLREQLRDDLVIQMRKISDELSSGRAADHSEYKRLVGVIQGLRKALDTVDACFNKLLDEQDD